MSNESDTKTTPDSNLETKAKQSNHVRYALTGLALLGLVGFGVAAGAVGMKYMTPGDAQVLLEPVTISAMVDDTTVAVKGTVAEIFGNKFIVQDASGRTLIDLGRQQSDWSLSTAAPLVTKDEAVTIQGHFEDGVVRATMLIHADGKADDLRPFGPKHHKGHGRDKGDQKDIDGNSKG